MRIAANLTPMTPKQARTEMKAKAAHRELNCISCHTNHRFDTRRAAVDACLNCHDDEHSLNYRKSSHFAYWQQQGFGETMTKGVSCATCHMPRIEKNGEIRVEHNQNANLRPNEKMLRTSCMKCHGLQFSINSLADRKLVKKNFQGQPELQIPSLNWAKEREK